MKFFIIALFLSVVSSCSQLSKETTKYKHYKDVGLILEYDGFILSFNEELKIANWAEYQLKCSDLESPHKREDKFLNDKRVNTLKSSDFKNSGYDRGHLVPARDRSKKKDQLEATFYMPNIAPQTPYFNRNGLWKKSESYLRDLSCSAGELKIIVGTVLNGLEMKEKLPIAKYFYKIARKPNQDYEVYIFPHSEEKSDIQKYRKNCDDIEGLTQMSLCK